MFIHWLVEFIHSSLNFGKIQMRQVVPFVSNTELEARCPEAFIFLIDHWVQWKMWVKKMIQDLAATMGLVEGETVCSSGG